MLVRNLVIFSPSLNTLKLVTLFGTEGLKVSSMEKLSKGENLEAMLSKVSIVAFLERGIELILNESKFLINLQNYD
jgi:hypothetical protein